MKDKITAQRVGLIDAGVDADCCMICTRNGLERYGVRCGDTLFLKLWKPDGKLFAVHMRGAEEATVITRKEFDGICIGDITFYAAVVYVGRSLEEAVR